MTSLFTSYWESNDWSEWDSFTSGGTRKTKAAAALGGSSYGIWVDFDALGDGGAGVAATMALKDLGNFAGFTEYTVAHRVDPRTLEGSGGTPYPTVTIYDTNPLRRFIIRLFDNGTNQIYVSAGVHDDSSALQDVGSFALTPITTETLVTVRVKKASSDVASDGELEIYFNGASKDSRTDIDIYDRWSAADPMELRFEGLQGINNTEYYVDALTVDSGFPGFPASAYTLTHSAEGIPGSII
jgi:hypothetical protein